MSQFQYNGGSTIEYGNFQVMPGTTMNMLGQIPEFCQQLPELAPSGCYVRIDVADADVKQARMVAAGIGLVAGALATVIAYKVF